MRGKPTRGRRIIQMLYDLANDDGCDALSWGQRGMKTEKGCQKLLYGYSRRLLMVMMVDTSTQVWFGSFTDINLAGRWDFVMIMNCGRCRESSFPCVVAGTKSSIWRYRWLWVISMCCLLQQQSWRKGFFYCFAVYYTTPVPHWSYGFSNWQIWLCIHSVLHSWANTLLFPLS